MYRMSDAHQQDLIDKVMEVAERRLGADQLPAIGAFIRPYYAHVPLEDILGESADNLFGAAFSHWRLAARRAPGTPNIRVYNPSIDEHGWRSEHTVVEIVTDNMPFLVDSVTAEFNRREMDVLLVIHPVLAVRRDDEGNLIEVLAPGAASGETIEESFIHVAVNRQPEAALAEIAASLNAVLADVRAAVEDWHSIRDRVDAAIAELASSETGASRDDVEEMCEFLRWIGDNNFTFLGYREYAFEETGETDSAPLARIVPDSGLGILRDPRVLVFEDLRDGAAIPPAVRAFVERPDVLVVAKADRLSTVHRPVLMDTLVVKRFATGGMATGERVFAGLFAASAYNRSVRSIPLLRRKLQGLIARAGFDPRGHDGRALINIVETFPRDELFQISLDHLLKTALGILNLQQRQRVALFLRGDDFERFISCLIYVPRDRYTTDLRLTIQGILERAFAGTVTAQYSHIGDSPLARLQLFIKTTPGKIPEYDAEVIEQEIIEASRTWSDHLQAALIAAHGEENGFRLMERYGDAFPAGYRDRFNAEQAVADVDKIETVLASEQLGMSLYRPFDAADHQFRFKVYHADRPLVLSHALPLLEHLGLRVRDEVPHEVRVNIDGGRTVLIHDFGLETQSGKPIDLAAVRDNFKEAFLAVWEGRAESDHYNGLVLEGGLASRQVAVVRACSKYLRQAGFAFSQAYMQRTLLKHPHMVRLIIELFHTLFDPADGPEVEAHANEIAIQFAAGLDEVASADEDRILRRFLNVVESMLRTNYFQTAAEGGPKPYLAFKLDSSRIDGLPLPRPMVEVFVYSPRMEGIHLRGGKVARGGIRWSDRPEDFRTEILGLMKAQMVKNAVIVPVGAKGGFVVKHPPPGGDREAVQAEGIACYQTLIRGLLDLTDNLVGNKLVPPVDVVRRDGDDPYLVVAADKGTATFSDIANGLAEEYGFWLGDAFASGGSHGYDHKKMGITARGAWESVKRHFRELGTDIQSEPFTVVGVGDMSGDVFGNGMLLSPCIKLLAAFNHLHIFVDPDPDPKASLAERRRLFGLPRSAWSDYDRKVLSPGGMVFERRAKSLTLTAEIKQRFGIQADTLTPNELIRRLLATEVDLLWFGGIGTYVKAKEESDTEVGDRANDAIRVNGSELRCKVVGEGANLGFTQLGRIEYAVAGGKINTDFIDNSAGVDCSDHEVNIKILLDAVVASGDMTVKQRNNLLVEMTDEVADLVLRDNYLQTQAISLIESRGADALDAQVRLMRGLEREGLLNRAVESLPDDETLAERAAAGRGLTRPEIAALFSHGKIALYDWVLDSDLPDDQHLAIDVVRYFPSQIQKRLKKRIPEHRLRRELIATSITNSLINRVSDTFITEIADKTAMPPVEIAKAYIVSRDVFAVREAWEQIEALDNRVASSVQITLHREAQRLVERGTLWFLHNGGSPIDITANVTTFRSPVTGLAGRIGSVLPEEMNERILFRAKGYQEEGVPKALAERVAYLIAMPSACDIVRIAAARGIDIEDVARLYFTLGEDLGFGWLRYQAEKFQAGSHWEKLAVAAILEELYGHQRDLTMTVLDTATGAGAEALAVWRRKRRPAVERMEALLQELQAAAPLDLSMLTVATRQLGALRSG